MIRWLHNSDYALDINDRNLQQIWTNQRVLNKTEQYVLEEIRSYIGQRYDLDREFSNTGTYSIGVTYSASDRIILDYATFSATKAYVYGDCVINNGCYICASNSIAATSSFNLSDWSYLGEQYDIFYCKYPEPYYDTYTYYLANERIFYSGITWSCMIPSTDLTKTQRAQFLYDEYIPGVNVIPTSNLNSNNAYWMPGSSHSYVIPAGTWPTDTQYWTKGDNRCQMLLNKAMDLTLYYLERSIAPRNINDVRKEMHKQALQWLDDVANGEFTISTPYLIPEQGTMFRAGGNPQDPNSW